MKVEYPKPNDKKIKCKKCGIELEGISYYWCPEIKCPIQIKVIY